MFSGEGLLYAALLTALTVLAGGASFASVEKLSIGNSIYWAITTMTTVGGDITPKTSEGKAIAAAVMLVGVGFAALVIDAAADRFVNPRVQEGESTDDELLAQVRAFPPNFNALSGHCNDARAREAAARPASFSSVPN